MHGGTLRSSFNVYSVCRHNRFQNRVLQHCAVTLQINQTEYPVIVTKMPLIIIVHMCQLSLRGRSGRMLMLQRLVHLQFSYTYSLIICDTTKRSRLHNFIVGSAHAANTSDTSTVFSGHQRETG